MSDHTQFLLLSGGHGTLDPGSQSHEVSMDDERLNGNPQDFPHREEAQNIYRALWACWLISRNPEEKTSLEEEMDAQQLRISRGPGSVWRAFAASLPGFNAWWAREATEMADRCHKDLQP